MLLAQTPEAAAAAFTLQIDRRLPRAGQVYKSLREAILELRLKPGTPISENWICQQCGISRTPAREALIRLTHDELIMVFPQQGSFVAPIRLKKVIEASFIREALEISILKMASQVWQASDTKAVSAILERQRIHADNNDNKSFFLEDQNFHHYFAQVVGAEGMSTIINEAASHLVRIRRLTHPIEGRMQKALLDHQKILAQMARGKVEGAINELTMHLSQVFRTFTVVAELHPEFFQDFTGIRDDIPEAMRRYLSSNVRADPDAPDVTPRVKSDPIRSRKSKPVLRDGLPITFHSTSVVSQRFSEENELLRLGTRVGIGRGLRK